MPDRSHSYQILFTLGQNPVFCIQSISFFSHIIQRYRSLSCKTDIRNALSFSFLSYLHFINQIFHILCFIIPILMPQRPVASRKQCIRICHIGPAFRQCSANSCSRSSSSCFAAASSCCLSVLPSRRFVIPTLPFTIICTTGASRLLFHLRLCLRTAQNTLHHPTNRRVLNDSIVPSSVLIQYLAAPEAVLT